jgi:hypothetical protein
MKKEKPEYPAPWGGDRLFSTMFLPGGGRKRLEPTSRLKTTMKAGS